MHKVLIIEDEEDIRETLVDVVSMESYIVYSASNGVEGIQKAIEFIPDLIVCDVMMPEMNGYDVIKHLKQNPLTFAIPFLFLTARSEKSDRRYGMELGADDYITKPFQGEEILRAIETRISKHSEIKKYHDKTLEDLRKNITSALPHEMRTPLTIMIGFAQIMKNSSRKLSFDEIENMAASISDAGDRLLKLIANYTFYVELLSIESANSPLKTKTTNLPERIILDTANSIAMQYDRTDDINIALNNISINIPEQYFNKIIEEVVDNAFKFSEKGTQITIRSEINKDSYRVMITDRGRGFETEQITRIGAFMQFDRNSFEQQGAGLGLAIADKALKIYNGKLEIETQAEQYTTVSINVPFANK